MEESGMGAYHREIGFDTFTHYKSIVDKKTCMDLTMRYQPYTKLSVRLIHMFLQGFICGTDMARNFSLMDGVKRFLGKDSLEMAYYFISDAPIKAVCNPSAYDLAGT